MKLEKKSKRAANAGATAPDGGEEEEKGRKTYNPGGPGAAFNEDVFLSVKQEKEKQLAERARVAAEREGLELAIRKGEFVTLKAAQDMLEAEHLLWITALEEWRQTIIKKMSKLGIPVEMQEAIAEMILKQTTETRQKRAVAQ
jgi:hypothetical protein